MLRAELLRVSAAAPAWSSLTATLRPFVARRVAPADVDDVLQDALLRVHRGVAGVRDDERLGPWMYRVARSAVADHRRARARHPVAREDPPDAPAEREDDDDRVFSCRVDQHLDLLVASLDEPYRSAVRWTELEGLTQAEVARRLGVPLSTVKSRVQHGRQRLRETIERLCAVTVDARGRVVACDARAEGCCAPEATKPR